MNGFFFFFHFCDQHCLFNNKNIQNKNERLSLQKTIQEILILWLWSIVLNMKFILKKQDDLHLKIIHKFKTPDKKSAATWHFSLI